MKPRLYLDGCSYVWGAGLDPYDNLESQFAHEFDVTNLSRGGKSNLAIAMDAYQHAKDYDAVVIGWTYATRFFLRYEDINLDFFPQKQKSLHPLSGNNPNIDTIEMAYYDFHKYFYTLFTDPFIDELSDMLVAQSRGWLAQNNSRVVHFSWEHRDIDPPVYQPYMSPDLLLPCGHMNKQGTQHLYNVLRPMLDA